MNDAQLLRYSRHILLDQLGIEGQNALLSSRVLVIGAGGLGSPASMYLVASGIGHLVLADADIVELTNLQRQILHGGDSVGMLKVASSEKTLRRLNAECRIDTLAVRLEGEALHEQVSQADVVLDCSDNFVTRHAVNRACVVHRIPLVSGAAVRFDGQISVFDPRCNNGGCYHCLFPEEGAQEDTPCAQMGVFAPLVGIIGATQAAEAIKLLCGCGETLMNRLLLLDSLQMRWREIRLRKDPACTVCAVVD